MDLTRYLVYHVYVEGRLEASFQVHDMRCKHIQWEQAVNHANWRKGEGAESAMIVIERNI